MNPYQKAADYVKQHIEHHKARFGIVLGTGLGTLANSIEDKISIPYADIPGFPVATVAGHSGSLVAGWLGGQYVICLSGRLHLYEGLDNTQFAMPMRMLHALGVRSVLLTNAAGSLQLAMGPGQIMLIEDHINFTGLNPLVGPNNDALGPRFPDLTETYSRHQNVLLRSAAGSLGIELFQGVYLCVTGPSFETPAEIRMFKQWGADAVGMSTVPEAIIARHAGMEVAAVSVITNFATGMSGTAHSHNQTLKASSQSANVLSSLVQKWLEMQ